MIEEATATSFGGTSSRRRRKFAAGKEIARHRGEVSGIDRSFNCSSLQRRRRKVVEEQHAAPHGFGRARQVHRTRADAVGRGCRLIVHGQIYLGGLHISVSCDCFSANQGGDHKFKRAGDHGSYRGGVCGDRNHRSVAPVAPVQTATTALVAPCHSRRPAAAPAPSASLPPPADAPPPRPQPPGRILSRRPPRLRSTRTRSIGPPISPPSPAQSGCRSWRGAIKGVLECGAAVPTFANGSPAMASW